ncbi:hypothetical protein M3F63_00070 [Brachybacterium muris]|uniref:UDP binding domain-containing protein n=1 Tax=Brachybacterium muris TaxID=219301 RepID=UPI00223C1240|nr:hypothetical protein [Brachybacterium muris]
MEDTLRPDRLVYGVADRSGAEQEINLLDAVYSELIGLGIPRKVYNFESGELDKVSANSFLATRISFINAISELCDVTGADVNDVAEAIGVDDRIGPKFLRAGIGFGGGCLPKDIRGLISRAGELGTVDSFAFLRDIDAINQGRREYEVRLAKRLLDGAVDDKRIAVLGAAFEPDTDDPRLPRPRHRPEALLRGRPGDHHRPVANENVRRRYPSFHVEDSTEDTLHDADLVLLLTEWKQYRDLDPRATRELVSTAQIIDGRNALDLATWREAGWQVEPLGRP